MLWRPTAPSRSPSGQAAQHTSTATSTPLLLKTHRALPFHGHASPYGAPQTSLHRCSAVLQRRWAGATSGKGPARPIWRVPCDRSCLVKCQVRGWSQPMCGWCATSVASAGAMLHRVTMGALPPLASGSFAPPKPAADRTTCLACRPPWPSTALASKSFSACTGHVLSVAPRCRCQPREMTPQHSLS